MITLANARDVVRVGTSDTHEFLKTPPRKLRSSREEREELDAILPWGLGGVIETVATTLDDIISDAMDRRAGRTGLEDVSVEQAAPSSSSPSLSSSSPWPISSPSSQAVWSISWNDIFGDDTEDEQVTDLPSTPPRDDAEMQKLQKELRRCRNQNGRMKKKIAALEAQVAHRPDDGAGPDPEADEEVLTMEIRHLLAQLAKLAYENDSLKRENKRLEELVDYFFHTSCGGRGDESDDDRSADTCYSYSPGTSPTVPSRLSSALSPNSRTSRPPYFVGAADASGKSSSPSAD